MNRGSFSTWVIVHASGNARQKLHDVNRFRLVSSAFMLYRVCGRPTQLGQTIVACFCCT